MTKVAIITDTHFGVRADSPVFHEYFERSFRWFFTELEKQNIGHIIHLGDLFDRRKYLNYVTSKVCRESFLAPIESLGIDTHIICGNHDVYWKNTNDVNSLSEIVSGKYDYIKTYSEPALISIGGLDIQLIPWINSSNYEHCHDTIKTSKSDILMGHFEINGFELFRGVMSNHGDDKEMYNRFDKVLSGHYHHKSSVGNIHYLGSFMEHTWADYNDPRGFHILDTNTRELEYYSNPHVIFKMISYDDEKHKDIVEKIVKKNYDEYKDCYVKIVCVSRTNPYAFDLLLDKLYKVGPVDISVVEDMNAIIDNAENDEIDQSQDTPSILSSYISGLTLTVNPDKMIDYMKDVYSEALQQEHVE